MFFPSAPRPATAAGKSIRRDILIALASALSLAACGGGSNGGPPDSGGTVTTPTPTPPTATPPPTAQPLFGALGQVTTQPFVVLGFGYRGVEVGGWGDMAVEPASVDPTAAIGLRYVAGSPPRLNLAIGGVGEGVLHANGGGGTDAQGRTNALYYNVLGGASTLSLVQRRDGDYLTSSAAGAWIGPPGAGANPVYSLATFVYGVATAPGQVPQDGTGIYEAEIWGIAALASDSDQFVGYVSGPARLSIDFAARRVSGVLALRADNTDLDYAVTDVVFTADGTGFRGRLAQGGVALDSFIEGRFTGATGRELLVRWQAPLAVGGRNGLAFGVWAVAVY